MPDLPQLHAAGAALADEIARRDQPRVRARQGELQRLRGEASAQRDQAASDIEIAQLRIHTLLASQGVAAAPDSAAIAAVFPVFGEVGPRIAGRS